jgi:hypothetical protein
MNKEYMIKNIKYIHLNINKIKDGELSHIKSNRRGGIWESI